MASLSRRELLKFACAVSGLYLPTLVGCADDTDYDTDTTSVPRPDSVVGVAAGAAGLTLSWSSERGLPV